MAYFIFIPERLQHLSVSANDGVVTIHDTDNESTMHDSIMSVYSHKISWHVDITSFLN